MTLAGATQQLYRLSWRIPFFGKLASSSTPGYAAFILHHQDSAIALLQVALAGIYRGTEKRFGQQIYVEVKPTVGDDYPAILRKIKAQRRRTPRDYSSWCWAILIGDYVGQGVNRDQFVEIFQRSNIRVIFLDDVKGDSTKQIDANVSAMIDKDLK